MLMNVTINPIQQIEVIKEIKLQVNNKLFKKRYITKDMYEKAKEIIINSK